MAFMLSARSAPDQKHALEAPWDQWVLLISVVDRLLHDLPLALSNLVKRARHRPAHSYAPCAIGSRYLAEQIDMALAVVRLAAPSDQSV
jgi:hypothetical protein